jgi:hypothetical protein
MARRLGGRRLVGLGAYILSGGCRGVGFQLIANNNIDIGRIGLDEHLAEMVPYIT